MAEFGFVQIPGRDDEPSPPATPLSPHKEGFLLKFTGLLNGWRKRYFVSDGGLLLYFLDSNTITHRGFYNLNDAVITVLNSDPCRFIIDSNHSIIHLRASSPEECLSWVRSLTLQQSLMRGDFKRCSLSSDQKDKGDILSALNDALFRGTSRRSQFSSQVQQLRALVDALVSEEQASTGIPRGTKDQLRLVSLHAQQCETALLTILQELQSCVELCGVQGRQSLQGSAAEDDTLFQSALDVLDLSSGVADQALPVRPKYSGGSLCDTPVVTDAVAPAPCVGDETPEDSSDVYFDLDDIQASVIADKTFPKLANSTTPAKPPRVSRIEKDDPSRVSTAVAAAHKAAAPFSEYQSLRRPALPSNRPDKNVNLFALIRNSVGKDLTKLSLPVELNEPLSFLQRLAEEVEYAHLLDMACRQPTSIERLVYVAAFAASAYSSTTGRIYKPFEPVVRETFEFVHPGTGVRVLSEVVGDDPPTCAMHTEKEGKWEYYFSLSTVTRFWGKSLEILPQGRHNVSFLSTGEHFVWEKVTSCAHNILMGEIYVDHYGQMKVENLNTGDVCVLTFMKRGWWDANAFEVSGTVTDQSGRAHHKVYGKWNDCIVAENLRDNTTAEIWRVNERPACSQRQYGLTAFAMQLNNVSPALRQRLPPTDSRLRKDIRALEEGSPDTAEKERQKIEAAELQLLKETPRWAPAWFVQNPDKSWVPTRTYWPTRTAGNFRGCPQLFS